MKRPRIDLSHPILILTVLIIIIIIVIVLSTCANACDANDQGNCYPTPVLFIGSAPDYETTSLIEVAACKDPNPSNPDRCEYYALMCFMWDLGDHYVNVCPGINFADGENPVDSTDSGACLGPANTKFRGPAIVPQKFHVEAEGKTVHFYVRTWVGADKGAWVGPVTICWPVLQTF